MAPAFPQNAAAARVEASMAESAADVIIR